MSAVIIYHNPRCSKSCATLALLRERGIELQVIEYLNEPPDAGEIKHMLELLGLNARALLRKGEPAYRKLGLDDAALSEEALIAAMVREPVLMERPVVIFGSKAALGRPPENALKVFAP